MYGKIHFTFVQLKNHYVPSVSSKPLWSVIAKKASTNRRLGGQTSVKVQSEKSAAPALTFPPPLGLTMDPFGWHTEYIVQQL